MCFDTAVQAVLLIGEVHCKGCGASQRVWQVAASFRDLHIARTPLSHWAHTSVHAELRHRSRKATEVI